MSTNQTHIHKYQQIRWGKNGTIIYRCMLSDCSHYLHREMVKGKSSVCWTCGGTTVMDDENLRRTKPRCFGSCSSPASDSRSDSQQHPTESGSFGLFTKAGETESRPESVGEIASRLTRMIKD